MSPSSNGAGPLVSFRHARIGRVGEAGQMPGGWRGEHLDDIEIGDVGSRGLPWITLRLGFGMNAPAEFAGLALAPYLPAPKAATIALAAEITLGEWRNVAEVLVILREWQDGGRLLTQANRSLSLVSEPQAASASHTMTSAGSVAEPLLMIRRESVGAAMMAVTFRGLTFGIAGDPAGRRPAMADDI